MAGRTVRSLVAALLAAAAGVLITSLLVAAPAEATSKTVAKRSGWTWFQEPRVLHARGATFIGSVSNTGDVRVSRVDDRTGAVRTGTVSPRVWGWDDHSAPALVLRPDGRLVAFYSGHGLGEMYYRISAAGPDVTRWGVQRRLVGSGLTTGARTRDGATYPSVVYHPTERRYYLVLRFGVRHEYYVTSSKDLVRWTVAAPLFRNAVHGLPDRPRPYAKVVAAATGTIHIAVTTSNPHPDTDSDLYAFTVRGGWLRTATGSPIRSFSTLRRVGPVSVRAGTKVRDDPGDASIRLWDLSLDRASRPVIAYIRRGRTYGVSRSTGRTWEHADVAPAPTGRYQGIAVAAGSPLSLYAVAAGTGLIERWTATSWPSGWVRRIMSREVSNRAPATPKSAPGRVVVAFMSGPYTTYDVFSSSIVASTAQPDGGTPLLPPPIAGARRSVPDELLPQVFPPFDG